MQEEEEEEEACVTKEAKPIHYAPKLSLLPFLSGKHTHAPPSIAACFLT